MMHGCLLRSAFDVLPGERARAAVSLDPVVAGWHAEGRYDLDGKMSEHRSDLINKIPAGF